MFALFVIIDSSAQHQTKFRFNTFIKAISEQDIGVAMISPMTKKLVYSIVAFLALQLIISAFFVTKDKGCKTPWLRSLLFWRLIDLKVQI